MRGDDPAEMIAAVLAGEIVEAFIVDSPHGIVCSSAGYRSGDWLIDAIRRSPRSALIWLTRRHRPPDRTEYSLADQPAGVAYFQRLDEILADLPRIDFYARYPDVYGVKWQPQNQPFDRQDGLPRLLPAAPTRRSALFLHSSYYHFKCLGNALRSRGWNTLTVSIEAQDSSQRQFYHGEDLNLHDPDPLLMREKVRDFFKTVPDNFGSLHFYGMGMPTFFPDRIENDPVPRNVPWDFLELRRHRLVIGYMPSGCLDGGAQSSIRALADDVCGACVWEGQPSVCNDAKSLAWNAKLAALCDWVGLESDFATPERIGERTVYGPVVTALDPDVWQPALDVPRDMLVEREPGEVLIYHAVGNYESRRSGDRDMKGTGAVVEAVGRLRNEGLPLRLVFAQHVPSSRVRFLQVQADIVVDQLNYGRYGANAREAMMLGKPTICRLKPQQAAPLPPLRAITEAPLVDADPETVTSVLRDLVLDPARRAALGRSARDYALAWVGQDACAARYETIIDRIRAGLTPETQDLYPAPPAER